MTVNNYIMPDNATREAVELLKRKAEDNHASIELTRNELLSLSKALQDLDQRTSGIKKLPDGRTQFGHMVSGEPTIVLQELITAERLFIVGDFTNALEHARNAIKVYEETKKISQYTASTGELKPEGIHRLYQVGIQSAEKLQNYKLAYNYATNLFKLHPSIEHQAILAITLFNIGKIDEAIVMVNKAVEADPNNKKYQSLKEEISMKAMMPQSGGG